MKFSLYTSLFSWLIRRALDLLIRGITAIHGQTTVIRFLFFEEITKTPRNKIHQTSESQCNFWQMKFKRSLWKEEFKSPTNLWCLLKSILRVLKTRKASLQHELVCNKTMTAYDEVILIVAIDTVNSLWSTNSNGSLVYLIDSNQVNRAEQANNCKCPLNTHWCPLCKSNFCPLQYP